MKSYKLLSLSFLLMAAPGNAALVNYVITGYATGSNAISGGNTDVPGGGTDDNTILVDPNGSANFVDFTIGDANLLLGTPVLDQTAAQMNALPTVATLRVSLAAVTGGAETMIARTSNSQGLVDPGTITLLLTGPGTNSTSVLSGSFRFDWRNAANDGPLEVNAAIVFTSYDIDFTQRNRVAQSDYSVIGLAPDTRLNLSDSAGVTTLVDPVTGSPLNGSNSSFDEPRNAYAFITNSGDNTQVINVDKAGGGTASSSTTAGNQLYMFSFRSPSPLVTAIPEPSAVLLGGLGLLALLRRRR